MPEPNADREPELLTIAAAAVVLRAPVATLRDWRDLGAGPNSFRLVDASCTAAPTYEAGSTLEQASPRADGRSLRRAAGRGLGPRRTPGTR